MNVRYPMQTMPSEDAQLPAIESSRPLLPGELAGLPKLTSKGHTLHVCRVTLKMYYRNLLHVGVERLP
jgi:hypothetical protein